MHLVQAMDATQGCVYDRDLIMLKEEAENELVFVNN